MNSIRDTSLHNDLNLEEVPIKNVVAKSAFLLKVCPPIRYAVAHAVMLSKKQRCAKGGETM